MTLLYLAAALIAAAMACIADACILHYFRPRMLATGFFGNDPFMHMPAPVRRLITFALFLAFLAGVLSVLSIFVT